MDQVNGPVSSLFSCTHTSLGTAHFDGFPLYSEALSWDVRELSKVLEISAAPSAGTVVYFQVSKTVPPVHTGPGPSPTILPGKISFATPLLRSNTYCRYCCGSRKSSKTHVFTHQARFSLICFSFVPFPPCVFFFSPNFPGRFFSSKIRFFFFFFFLLVFDFKIGPQYVWHLSLAVTIPL